MPEDDRVGDLHHRRLEVHGEEHALLLRVQDLPGQEGGQRSGAHDRRVDDLAGLHLQAVLEDRRRAVGRDVLDAQRRGRVERHRRLGVAEVALGHRRDVAARVGRPGTHGVRVLLGVVLHRRRRPAVGVALAQHRVHRAALHRVVRGAGRALVVGLRVLGVVGDRVPGRLQLGDGRLELRHRGADVGQLDDVGVGRLGERPELGEGVVGEVERREDAPRQRDVARLDVDAGLAGVGLQDGQQRVGRERRRLVGVGVDDLHVARGHLRSAPARARRPAPRSAPRPRRRSSRARSRRHPGPARSPTARRTRCTGTS